MLRIHRVTPESPELDQIHTLYEKAFPPQERSSFRILLHDSSAFYAFFDGEIFCGFATLLIYKDLCHILYLSIDESLRDRGYGTQALKLIREELPGVRILVDIEKESNRARNQEQRHKRKHFYLQNGYRETGIQYHWRHEPYEMLVNGNDVSEAEFEEFWEHFKIEGKASEF